MLLNFVEINLNDLNRRVAYTALKEGVESSQECNDKLEEDLITRYCYRLSSSSLTLHVFTSLLLFYVITYAMSCLLTLFNCNLHN